MHNILCNSMHLYICIYIVYYTMINTVCGGPLEHRGTERVPCHCHVKPLFGPGALLWLHCTSPAPSPRCLESSDGRHQGKRRRFGCSIGRRCLRKRHVQSRLLAAGWSVKVKKTWAKTLQGTVTPDLGTHRNSAFRELRDTRWVGLKLGPTLWSPFSCHPSELGILQQASPNSVLYVHQASFEFIDMGHHVLGCPFSDPPLHVTNLWVQFGNPTTKHAKTI